MAFKKSILRMAALAAALTVGLTLTAQAGSRHETRRYDPTDQVYGQHAMGVRYPGDVATPWGTVHKRGDELVPYVERCHWTFDINSLGLPWHFRQVCKRHYGRPVKAVPLPIAR